MKEVQRIIKKHYGQLLTEIIETTDEEEVYIEIKIKTKDFECSLK